MLDWHQYTALQSIQLVVVDIAAVHFMCHVALSTALSTSLLNTASRRVYGHRRFALVAPAGLLRVLARCALFSLNAKPGSRLGSSETSAKVNGITVHRTELNRDSIGKN